VRIPLGPVIFHPLISTLTLGSKSLLVLVVLGVESYLSPLLQNSTAIVPLE